LRAHGIAYAPANVMWTMMPPVPVPDGKRKLGKGDKRKIGVERALRDLASWLAMRDDRIT
jgi:hypothetical protein